MSRDVKSKLTELGEKQAEFNSKLRKKEPKVLKEFKEFIVQGNAINLAIGVVMGAAFSSIVNSLVGDIIMPLISLIGGGTDFTKLSVTIPNFFGADTSAEIKYGNFIQTLVNFLIIAFALFLTIRFVNRMNRRAKEAAKRAEQKLGIKRIEEEIKEEKEAEKTASDEQTKLLKQILQELKKSNKE